MEQSKKDELKHRYETLFGHAIDKFFIDKTFDFFFKIIEGEEKDNDDLRSNIRQKEDLLNQQANNISGYIKKLEEGKALVMLTIKEQHTKITELQNDNTYLKEQLCTNCKERILTPPNP